MDLVYMPEVLTYGSFRTPAYRDYEQPWNKNYFQYGKSFANQTTRQQQEQIQHHQSRTTHKENCYLCKESKRRALGSYIRRRSRTSSCNEIYEEEEEEEEEKEDGEDVATTTDVSKNKDDLEKKE
ncbi:uncharacterized protein fok [Chelonus insularis]|uniref:uncharacterized protein fok n=1 Tax=Chelonus insularis TaxID=460826 RepID=UPI00158A858B|nr:uncharacterized protein LOC118072531 [Chelonus insularis]